MQGVLHQLAEFGTLLIANACLEILDLDQPFPYENHLSRG